MMASLPPVVQELITNIRHSHPVEKIYLFGSRASGNHTEKADIDIAISSHKLTKKNWLEILNAIEDAQTLYKIDCVWLEEAPSSLRYAILQKGIQL